MSFFCKFFNKKENKAAVEYAIEGEYYVANSENRNALKAFNKAIELEPDNDMFYASRSKAYKNMEKYKEALADIEKALTLQPNIDLYKKLKRQIMIFID